MALTGVLFVLIPKGFFPTQDTGLITGLSEAAQDVSPHEMKRLHAQRRRRARARSRRRRRSARSSAAAAAIRLNTGRFFIGLKPREERNVDRGRR